jgi:hypothetical protein
MITLPPDSAGSLYRRRQDELRVEIHRVRSARIPTPERNRLVRRLVSAVRELQMARDNPEIFTWRYYTAQMSWLRISGVVTCVTVGALVIPETFRRGHEWSVVSVLLMITVVGAIWVPFPDPGRYKRDWIVGGSCAQRSGWRSGRKRENAGLAPRPSTRPLSDRRQQICWSLWVWPLAFS